MANMFPYLVPYLFCFHFYYSVTGLALKVVSVNDIKEKLTKNIDMLINGINTKQFNKNQPDLGAEGYRYASLMVILIFPIFLLISDSFFFDCRQFCNSIKHVETASKCKGEPTAK